MLGLWFLNVGHGDSTIVRFPPEDRIAMVDINNAPVLDDESAKEIAMSVGGLTDTRYLIMKALGTKIDVLSQYERLLVNPVEFWNEQFPGEHIFRFILTHPDMDHLSGLYRLVGQEKIPVLNFWDTDNTKEMTEEDFDDSPHEYLYWLQYRVLRLKNKDHPKALHLYREQRAQYWTEDGVTILSPTRELVQMANDTENWHHLSYVVRIQYGESVVILTGDPSTEALQDIYEHFSDDFLNAGLLTAPHHGRDSGYHQPFVKAVSPKYTIVSVGKKPETDASNKYQQYSKYVYSTRFCGTMHAKCWSDGDIWLYDHQGNRLGD